LIVALAGGVGAARFLTGVAKIVKQNEISVIANTGDDIELFGLHISPDVDIVSYTLAGIVDEQKGWGIKDDTFQCLEMLKKYSADTWLNLGDRDLATHIYRTNRLKQGATLTEVTKEISAALGLKIKILPMTNEKLETQVTTAKGSMHFEEYYVKNKCQEEVLGVAFAGVDKAKPSPEVLEAISKAQTILVCPSNPIVSIGAILSVKGIREALRKTNAKIIGVSPIVAGAPIKGPADKLLRGLGYEVSAYEVAKLYADFLDEFVIDNLDSEQKARIEKLGITVRTTNTIMKTLNDKIALAKTALKQ
jgi:LPPG:FO 2-phospho-L-lactate transferase